MNEETEKKAREAKYIVLHDTVTNLNKGIKEIEELIGDLKGRKRDMDSDPSNKEEMGSIPSPSFQMVYDGLPSLLSSFCERLYKVRNEIRKLLI